MSKIYIEFDENFIKRAIADNFGISETDVNIADYGSQDVVDSLDWHIRHEDCELTTDVALSMYSVDDDYIDGSEYEWEDEYAKCRGILHFGEWEQDGSSDEYSRIPCCGWYVEVISVSPLSWSEDTKEEASECYPDYLKKQSVLVLKKNPTFCKVGVKE